MSMPVQINQSILPISFLTDPISIPTLTLTVRGFRDKGNEEL